MPLLGPERLKRIYTPEEIEMEAQIKSHGNQTAAIMLAISLNRFRRFGGIHLSAEALYQIEGQQDDIFTRAWVEGYPGTALRYLCTKEVCKIDNVTYPVLSPSTDEEKQARLLGPEFGYYGHDYDLPLGQRLELYKAGLETVKLVAVESVKQNVKPEAVLS